MQLANFNQVTVSSMGEATRRMVDLSLVLDVSSSIGSQWTAVRDAARVFVNAFDENNDRVALLTFSNGVSVLDADAVARAASTRPKVYSRRADDAAGRQHEHGRRALPRLGRAPLRADRPAVRPARHRALHRRRVQQRARQLRHGARPGPCAPDLRLPEERCRIPTARPGTTRRSPGSIDQTARTARPVRPTRCSVPPAGTTTARSPDSCLAALPYLPLDELARAPPQLRHSDDVPAADQRAERSTAPRSRRTRGLRNQNTTTGRYPADVWNINNAARNLVEIIANAARADARRLPDPHLHDRHGRARALQARHDPERDVRGDPQADRQRHYARRTSTRRRWRASTTTRRPRPTSVPRSRRCRTRSSDSVSKRQTVSGKR